MTSKNSDTNLPDVVLSESQFAEFTSHFYQAALDDSHYESLLEFWRERLNSDLNEGNMQNPVLQDAEFRQVLLRGDVDQVRLFLGEKTEAESDPLESRLTFLGISPAFTLSGQGDVVRANAIAREHYGFEPPVRLPKMPFEPESLRILQQQLQAAVASKSTESFFVTLLRPGSASLAGLHIIPLDADYKNNEKFLAISSEFIWPTEMTQRIADAFGLSASEIAIVRSLTMGQSLQDISAARKRSLETIRTQLRSVFLKTGVKSQQELLLVVLRLVHVLDKTQQSNRTENLQHETIPLAPAEFHTLMRPDGRRVDYRLLGDPASSRSILYLPSNYGLTRWPASLEQQAREMGIRIIVPIRPGYGHSTEFNDRSRLLDIVSADMAAILEHLGVGKCPCISNGSDGIFAFHFHSQYPSFLTDLFICGGGLPLFNKAQYQRMDRWNRVLLSNARYAPFMLPLLIRASFLLAQRLGIEGFIRAVHSNSPGDLKTVSEREVLEAGLAGTDVVLSPEHSAYNAFANETILQQSDWRALVHGCQIPVTIFTGSEDLIYPPDTIAEMRVEFPHLSFVVKPDCGEFLFMKYCRELFALALEKLP